MPENPLQYLFMAPQSTSPQRVHFIGICGVGTSALAIAMHNAGYIVTGSDKGFFPPVSTELTHAGISYYAGWHPEKMLLNGSPDFIVAGGSGTGSTNPEIIAAKEKKIPIQSFAEAVGTYVVAKNSIVVAGTWGKTTSSALLAYILEHAGMNPSYFAGGVATGRPGGAIRKSDWSVVEGDEYKAAIWDEKAKFFYYKPTNLLLTAVSWDHADLYQTEETYFDAFRKLVNSIPKNGKIVVCADNENAQRLATERGGVSSLVRPQERAKTTRSETPPLSVAAQITTYGKAESATYRYENIKQSAEGISFDVDYHGKIYEIKSPMLGTYNAENITGCFAMAREIGIAPGDISDAIKEFRGMKRRLEKRYDHHVTVIDDIAHSPAKAASVLKNLRSIYPGKIVAIYEPNIGNRQIESLPAYAHAFDDADEVIIPRLSKLKTDDGKEHKALEGDELAREIGETHKNTKCIEDDEMLVAEIIKNQNDGDVIVFLGSHGFRGMIEETVEKIALATAK